MAFAGFDPLQIRFFKQLAAIQDRDWFKENKPQYVALAEAPMKALVEELRPAVARQYKGFALKPPKHFRIYRDVRFSKDKTPFKTHVAAMIGFEGSEDEGAPAALYLHFGLEDVIAAGHWMLPSEKLKRYRALVAAEKSGRELQKRLDTLTSEGFSIESFESTKRVPPGLPPDHPRAELLKHKGLGLGFPTIPRDLRFSPKLAKWIAERSAEAASVVTWLEKKLAD